MRPLIPHVRRGLLRAELWLGLAWAVFLVKNMRFTWWRKWLGPIDGQAVVWPPIPDMKRRQAANIGLLVNRIANRAPFDAKCLPQAMAARWALARRGIPSRIIIGSRRAEDGAGDKAGLLFHAWLMVEDNIVTGAEERAQYLEFTSRRAPSNAAGSGTE